MSEVGQNNIESDKKHNISLSRRSVLGAAGAVAVSGLLPGLSSARTQQKFDPIETTSWEIRQGYEQGAFTVEEVVRTYLDRINEYEDELQAVISINPHALERAAELDEVLNSVGSSNSNGRGPPSDSPGNGRGPPDSKGPSNLAGPLHGVPVLVKDNVNTNDIATTTGTVAMENMIPPESATIVSNIRDAGGVIIGKANMDEFAFGYTSSSSMGGTVRNPYDLDRTAGGSSGGPGAGIAANYAAIGIGTDTGGSVRVPSLANNMVGLRPTRQLVSSAGVSPLYSRQDVPGPMTRTVADAALMTDVLVATDPEDSLTFQSYDKTPHAQGERYTDYLNEEGLEEARIGVYSDWMPNGEPEDVAELFEDAFSDIERAGATLVRDLKPPSDRFVSEAYRGSTVHMDWKNYLANINEFEDLKELIKTGEIEHCGMTFALEYPSSLEKLENDVGFSHPYFKQRQLQQYVLEQMDENNLDAIMYPGNWNVPTLDEGGGWGPANLHLSPVLDWPAIVMPVGFSDGGVPVGMEFLGQMWSEPELFEIAYAYEQVSDNREPPNDFGTVEQTEVDWSADAIEKWNDERPVYDTVGHCDLPGISRITTAQEGPQDSNIDTRNLPGGSKPQ